MDNKKISITINHLDEYNGISNLKVGDSLILTKEFDNPYDDEAIAVYNKDYVKLGYVANSVDSVARGTYSSGRIWDQIDDNTKVDINYIYHDIAIGTLNIKSKTI